MSIIGNWMGGSRIPQAVRDEIVNFAAEFEGLRQADNERLERYRTYREEMERVRDPRHKVERSDYGRKIKDEALLERHRINLPFGQALTVKHTYRIAGRLPDVYVDPRDSSPLEEYRSATMEKIVWGLIRESNGEQQFASGAWDASKLGSACFDLYWDVRRQMPVFREIDPAGVVVVRGNDDPHDFRVAYRYWDVPLQTLKAQYGDIPFREHDSFVDELVETHKVGKLPMVTVVQRSDALRTTRFALGSNVPLDELDHGYGFVPYFVIPNLGPDREVWGWADYEFVRDLTEYLPLLFSREADIIRAHAGGAYLDKGTGQATARIREILAKGGVLPAKRESSLEPVPGPEVPDFLPTHVQTAISYLQMLGFAPPAAWGDGSAGSGSDRGLQLQPLLELTALKQANWSAGLSRLFGRAFQMIERKQVSRATYRGQVAEGGTYRRSPFTLILEPDVTDKPDIQAISGDAELTVLVPRTPRELFDGDYAVRFVWANRIDPDDPAFVSSELNKFVQGAQSLATTLARLGCQSPEDEMDRIEREAERFPWLRNGMIQLLRAQMQAEGGGLQGEGGGAPIDPGAGLDAALAMMQTKDGTALDADAGISALPGDSGIGIPYGGA